MNASFVLHELYNGRWQKKCRHVSNIIGSQNNFIYTAIEGNMGMHKLVSVNRACRSGVLYCGYSRVCLIIKPLQINSGVRRLDLRVPDLQTSCSELTMMEGPLGLYSLSGRTSCRKISWSPEATWFGFWLFQSPWNLTGTSAAKLPRCLPNFRAT